MALRLLTTLLSLSAFATAWEAPQYGGFSRVWQETFPGAAGTLPNEGTWTILNGDLGVNNELQVYKRDPRNVQISGGNTLQLVPWRDGSQPKGWTSGRMESKYTFTPEAGRVTRVEAAIMFGPSPTGNKQGIWPAYWMLGNSIRQGTVWPACGELDIMETVNGQLIGHGTVHCNVYPGGICNEGNGIGSSIGFPDQGWHTWRLEIDRRSGNYLDQSINWYLDGVHFHQVTGSRIGNAQVWASLAQSPLFFILNVAVGGDWPGSPNGNTWDGYGSRMEVGYVAHYVG
ncbi:secreted glucosidase [Emericellopsis atlantica]|uniref:Secreted glucosidase n=1 Tax=Emericellopsis atlantica TaxID=2614577 RepID=A0A9P8CU37_9HYPO|nr:secreted glucosidase [Emericellopsis atlantica]KAG9258765.1 secreted glucosidase [Emericellopsis atlantica]